MEIIREEGIQIKTKIKAKKGIKVYDYCGGLARVKLNDKWNFIDKSGKEVIECKYKFVLDFHEGLAQVLLNGKCGFIDQTGKEVIISKLYMPF